MKVQSKEKGFQPIELTIRIESEEELCDLWHRIYSAPSVVHSRSEERLKHKASHSAKLLFDELDALVNKYNLKK